MALWLVLKDFNGEIVLGGNEWTPAGAILNDAFVDVIQLQSAGCPMLPWNGTLAETDALAAFLSRSPTPGQPLPSENLLDLLATYGAFGGGGGPTPKLNDVLLAGNSSGLSDLLMNPAQQIDSDGPGSLKLGTVQATRIDMGNAVSPPGTDPLLLINQGGVQLNGSNAGIQYATTRANRAQHRFSQYGANTAGPGETGFKSRGGVIGSNKGVLDGDLLHRVTAIGVARDDVSIPLAALISLQVPPGGSLPASNYVSTEYELQLVPLEGPVNGAKVMFKVTSQGVPVLREVPLPGGGQASGVAILDAGGVAVIANPSVKAGTHFTLTYQDGGAVPVGVIAVIARAAGISFTIKSAAGAADATARVYWQLWEGHTGA